MTYPMVLLITNLYLVVMEDPDHAVVWTAPDPVLAEAAFKQFKAQGYECVDVRQTEDVTLAALRALVTTNINEATYRAMQSRPWAPSMGLPGERISLPTEEDEQWH